jgi:hypothetical protein
MTRGPENPTLVRRHIRVELRTPRDPTIPSIAVMVVRHHPIADMGAEGVPAERCVEPTAAKPRLRRSSFVRARLARLRFAMAIPLTFSIAACEPETIVIATDGLSADSGGGGRGETEAEVSLPDGVGGQIHADTLPDSSFGEEEQGHSPPTKTECRTSSTCGPGAYCEFPRCGVPTGICQPKPQSCSWDFLPVCGCDGHTYFNDCLRRIKEVPKVGAGECPAPESCDDGSGHSSCRDGAQCVKLSLASDCSSVLQLHCWMMPDGECSLDTVDSATWRACPGPGAHSTGTQSGCVGTCDAYRSGGLFLHAESCQ